MDIIKKQRQFMKSNAVIWDTLQTDQKMKLSPPLLEKSIKGNDNFIILPEVNENVLLKSNIFNIIKDRKSQRSFSDNPLSIEELSFLLWSTQGIKKVSENSNCTLRTVPSGGARHAFETYLVINRVDGLKSGVYRYLALTHRLVFLFEEKDIENKIASVTLGQSFIGKSAVIFIWSCIPYRCEWRYNILAHKNMLLDAGHVCQNLYLACEAIGCGTCAVGAYNQEALDKFLKLDGEDEFSIYLAPVGKL